MDPKDKFKERYNEYLSERNKQLAVKPSSITPASPKGRSYSPNKFYVLGIIVGLLIVGPAAAYLILSNQIIQNTTPSHISSVNVTPVSKITVTDAEIDSEMQKIWGQYYDQTKDDPKLREVAKKNIELRIAASKIGVATSSIASIGNSEIDNYSENQNKISSEIEKKVVNSRTIDLVSTFKNPGNNYETDKKLAVKLLNEIKTLVVQGQSMEDAYNKVKLSEQFGKTIRLSTNEYITKDSGWDKQLMNTIFSLKKGNVTDIIISPGGSFFLAKITDENNTNYKNVDEWLKTQK